MNVGIIRKVDDLGRVTIPKEYRRFYHFEENKPICIIDTPEGVLLTNPKYKVVEISKKETTYSPRAPLKKSTL